MASKKFDKFDIRTKTHTVTVNGILVEVPITIKKRDTAWIIKSEIYRRRQFSFASAEKELVAFLLALKFLRDEIEEKGLSRRLHEVSTREKGDASLPVGVTGPLRSKEGNWYYCATIPYNKKKVYSRRYLFSNRQGVYNREQKELALTKALGYRAAGIELYNTAKEEEKKGLLRDLEDLIRSMSSTSKPTTSLGWKAPSTR